MGDTKASRDPRVQATSAIWGIAVGMLGVCIPLVGITDSGVILPLLVILGASASTVSVWRTRSQLQAPREQQLVKTVAQLEERVRNLETICSDLEFDMKQPALRAEAGNIQRSA